MGRTDYFFVSDTRDGDEQARRRTPGSTMKGNARTALKGDGGEVGNRNELWYPLHTTYEEGEGYGNEARDRLQGNDEMTLLLGNWHPRVANQ